MLIRVKHPQLYRTWIQHLMAKAGVTVSTAAIRTEAFIRSEKNQHPCKPTRKEPDGNE
jgi:hypothetical protein